MARPHAGDRKKPVGQAGPDSGYKASVAGMGQPGPPQGAGGLARPKRPLRRRCLIRWPGERKGSLGEDDPPQGTHEVKVAYSRQ